MGEDRAADRHRDVVDQAGATEARGQPIPERREAGAVLRRGAEVGQDGQRRVARGQRGHGLPAEGELAPEQEPAVGLPPDDPLVVARALQLVEGGDDVGRADAGLPEQHAALAHASLDGVVRADGDGDGIGAQVLRDDDAEQIARKEAHAPARAPVSEGGRTAATSGRSESPSVETMA